MSQTETPSSSWHSILSMHYEAFLSGVLSSLGSTLGKLSGKVDSYTLMIITLVAMVLVNTLASRHYLRSMDASIHSITPTVISLGTSYVVTGHIGLLLFDDGASSNWWFGAFFIMAGLAILSDSQKYMKEKV